VTYATLCPNQGGSPTVIGATRKTDMDEQRQIIPGQEAITVTYGPVDPALSAWDSTEGDHVLIINPIVRNDQIGAVVQAAIDRLHANPL
jgi:hypothetical protein